MADFTIDITVTVFRNGTFEYKADGQPADQPLEIHVHSGDIATILLTVEPGTPGDSVVFSSTPILFLDSNHPGITVDPGSTTTTLIDDNTNTTPHPESEAFLIQVIYTPSGDSPETRTSPDPTIINTGTGGERLWTFPSK